MKQKKPFGPVIGGWLMVYVLLTSLSAIATAALLWGSSGSFSALAGAGAVGGGYWLFVRLAFSLAALLDAALVVLLFAKSKYFLNALLSAFLYNLLVVGVTWVWGGAIAGNANAGQIAVQLIPSAVNGLLWLTYFPRSVRVNAYMGSHEYLEKSWLFKLRKKMAGPKGPRKSIKK